MPSISSLQKIQELSAFATIPFIALHLYSALILPIHDVKVANEVFIRAKSIYQTPAGELTLVVLPVFAHLLSGYAIRFLRIYNNYKATHKLRLFKPSFTSLTGFLTTFFLVMHFLANRYAPIATLGDSKQISLNYIIYCLQTELWPTALALTILPLVFTAHFVSGLNNYLHIKLSLKVVIPITAAVCAISITKLYNAEPVSPALAGKYTIAHNYLKKILSFE